LVYDVTNENSFKNISYWIKQIDANAQTNVCKVLVGAKCDKLGRKVIQSEGQKLAKDYNMSFFETSARTNFNVNEVFYFLTNEILKTNEEKSLTGEGKLSKEDSSKKVKENEEYKNEISNLKNYIKELERKLKEKENKINEEKIKNEKLINTLKYFIIAFFRKYHFKISY